MRWRNFFRFFFCRFFRKKFKVFIFYSSKNRLAQLFKLTVRLQLGGRVVNGVGADPDIVIASAKAYLSALNKLQSKVERVAAQG